MSFRFDRFATLYVVNPLRRSASGKPPSIPILMYHSISDDAETGVHPYYCTTTTPAMFAVQMHHLHELGYRTIDVAGAVKLLQNGSHPNKCVGITFDDGYHDFYRHAFPTLSRFNFSATVFVPTAYIGTKPIQFKGKDCLTWNEVRELRKHGVSFGSHTQTHPQLSTLKANAVKDEVVHSKQTIEDQLGESVDGFAYPYAFPEQNVSFVQMLRETLADAGYQQGVSTRIGVARALEDRYFLRRLPMNSMDDMALLDAKLQGAYDWLHRLQYASKFLRSKVSRHD